MHVEFTSADKIVLDLHNTSYHTKAESNHCQLIKLLYLPSHSFLLNTSTSDS